MLSGAWMGYSFNCLNFTPPPKEIPLFIILVSQWLGANFRVGLSLEVLCHFYFYFLAGKGCRMFDKAY